MHGETETKQQKIERLMNMLKGLPQLAPPTTQQTEAYPPPVFTQNKIVPGKFADWLRAAQQGHQPMNEQDAQRRRELQEAERKKNNEAIARLLKASKAAKTTTTKGGPNGGVSTGSNTNSGTSFSTSGGNGLGVATSKTSSLNKSGTVLYGDFSPHSDRRGLIAVYHPEPKPVPLPAHPHGGSGVSVPTITPRTIGPDEPA